jgi:hypothetical protein
VLKFVDAIEQNNKCLHSRAETLIAKKYRAIISGSDPSEYDHSPLTPSLFFESLMTPEGQYLIRMVIQA